MNKRILSICLALALCLSLIPAAAFADSPLYTYTETKTGVKADGISMMDNGMGSYKTYDANGEDLTAKGVIDPSGKVIVSRNPQPGEGMMAGDATNDTHYAGYGNAIVDLMRVRRYGSDNGTTLSNTYQDGLTVYFDWMIYDKSGKLVSYVSDVIAKYEGVAPTKIQTGFTVYFGHDGYLTAYAYDDKGANNAYIIDPQKLQVVFKKMADNGSPRGDGEGWSVTSVNDGLIAYNHGHGVETDAGYYDYEYIAAGWMDINGNHKLSVDTDKYFNWFNFSDGLAMVSNMTGMMYGYVDKTGKEVVPCIYRNGSMFKDGYAYVQDEDGRYGYIDKTGKTVIPFQYEYAFGYGEGLFTVGHAGQYDNYYGMVDINNTEVVPTVGYTDISFAKNGIAYAIKDGEIVILKFAENKGGSETPEPAPVDPDDVTSIFEDVPAGAWYAKFLQKAYDAKIVGGTSVSTYEPDGSLTHGQIMVMVANLHSKMKGDGFQAKSVPGDHWAASFRDYCKAEGIIDARFDEALNANVTRAEMAYYFARTLSDEYYKDKKTVTFSDMPENGYDEYIMKLAKADIVGGMGDGVYAPGEDVTRAQAAVFISNILDAIEAYAPPAVSGK